MIKSRKEVYKKLRKVEEKSFRKMLRFFLNCQIISCKKSWEKIEEKKVENKLKKKSWEKVVEFLKKVEKTLPEAQRTQGIESITWIKFLTKINL